MWGGKAGSLCYPDLRKHITHIPITQRMFLFQMNKLLDKQYIKLYNFTPADCVCKPLDYPDPHP